MIRINLLPIAIKLAKYNERKLTETCAKWIFEKEMATRQSARDILTTGILHNLERIKETRASIIEMETQSRAFGSIIKWN